MSLLMGNASWLVVGSLMVGVLASGCLQASPDSLPPPAIKEAPEQPHEQSPEQTKPTPAIPPAEESWLTQFVLDDCAGWTGGLYIRKEIHPAVVPPEWQLNNTFGLAHIAYWVLDCHRLSAAPLERPVRLVLETHGRATPPPACEDPADEYWWLVNRAWINDQEAANVLMPRTGMPLQVAPIEVHRDELGVQRATATWGPSDEASQLSWEWHDDPSSPLPVQWGYYWFTEEGVAHAAFNGPSKTTSIKTGKVVGTIAPGLLYHEAIGEHFAGIGDPSTTTYDVHVTYYKDLLCEQPR